VFDGRTIYNRQQMKANGLRDDSIQRSACGETTPALEALNGGEAHPRRFQRGPS
jgi:hypothetical protein